MITPMYLSPLSLWSSGSPFSVSCYKSSHAWKWVRGCGGTYWQGRTWVISRWPSQLILRSCLDYTKLTWPIWTEPVLRGQVCVYMFVCLCSSLPCTQGSSATGSSNETPGPSAFSGFQTRWSAGGDPQGAACLGFVVIVLSYTVF